MTGDSKSRFGEAGRELSGVGGAARSLEAQVRRVLRGGIQVLRGRAGRRGCLAREGEAFVRV